MTNTTDVSDITLFTSKGKNLVMGSHPTAREERQYEGGHGLGPPVAKAGTVCLGCKFIHEINTSRKEYEAGSGREKSGCDVSTKLMENSGERITHQS